MLKRCLIALFILLFLWAKGQTSQNINKIVAVVGDEVLTLYEIDQLAEPFYRAYIPKEIPKEEAERLRAKIRKDLLEQWIEDTIIGLEAKKYGIKVNEQELEHYLKEEAKGAEGAKNLSQEEREKLRDRLTKIKFIQVMVRDKIAIPEEEIKKAYQQRVNIYDPTPKYYLELLIVKEENLAKNLYEALLKGKSMEALSKEYKEQTQYFKEVFKEEELDRAILEKLKDLKAGEITEPSKRGEAYQIIRLIKKEAGSPPSYEEMKKELYEELFQKKAQEYLEKWIKELKDTKFIKVYL